MKVLNVKLFDNKTVITFGMIEDVYIIRNENEHVEKRREVMLDYGVSFSSILNKCAEFTDANYIFCNLHYPTFEITEEILNKLNDADFLTFYSKFGFANICGALFIKTDLLRSSKFNDMFNYAFDFEWKNRNRDVKIENDFMTFHLDEEAKNEAFLEYEALEISEKLNTKNKNVIYTFCNDASKLPKIRTINNNFDYICFTTKLTEDIAPWEVIKSNFEKDIIKFFPSMFLNNYNTSIWIENDVNIKTDLNEFSLLLDDNEYILVSDDRIYKCAYDKVKKFNSLNYNKFKVEMILDKFPVNAGMIDSYVMLRRHNCEECKDLMKKWHILKCYFDIESDVCFNYIFWKYHGRYLSLPFEIINQRFFTKET